MAECAGAGAVDAAERRDLYPGVAGRVSAAVDAGRRSMAGREVGRRVFGVLREGAADCADGTRGSGAIPPKRSLDGAPTVEEVGERGTGGDISLGNGDLVCGGGMAVQRASADPVCAGVAGAGAGGDGDCNAGSRTASPIG